MKPQLIIKICVDIVMTVVLLLLMAYMLIGDKAHEWLGVVMIALIILHHVLNLKWWKNIFKGKYTSFRTAQTILGVLILSSILGSAVSGIVMSRHVFRFLNIAIGISWARVVHMICAYWGFVLMSLHLGFHWQMMTGMARRGMKNAPAAVHWGLKILGYGIAVYGLYAFFERKFPDYLLLRNQFAFFDMSEKLIFFILDYVAVMGLFVRAGHYIARYLIGASNKSA